ncbi:hypothetical protein BH20ACT13_BH20ACT13_22130 [soil metagenome]
MRDAELRDDLLGVLEQALVLVPGVLGTRESELLDLVEQKTAPFDRSGTPPTGIVTEPRG